MPLYGSLRVGVAGLTAQSRAVATTSDNIANVNTVGYKASRTRFSTIVTAPSGTAFTAGGVRTILQREVEAQGNLSGTAVTTNAAVDGDGFFTVTDALTRNSTTNEYDISGNVLFTRSGQFTKDENGNLVNPQGYYLTGWNPNSTDTGFEETSVHSSFKGMNVGQQTSRPTPTTEIFMSANLNAAVDNGSTFDISTQFFDRQGAERSITFTYTRQAAGVWAVTARVIGASTETFQGGIVVEKATTDADAAGTTQTNLSITGSADKGEAAVPIGYLTFNSNGTLARVIPVNTDYDGNITTTDYVDNGAAGISSDDTINGITLDQHTLDSDGDGSLEDETGQAVDIFSNLAGATGFNGTAAGTGLPMTSHRALQHNSTSSYDLASLSFYISTDGNVELATTDISKNGSASDETKDELELNVRFGTIGQTDGITQFDGANTLNYFTQNGSTFGSLTSVAISDDGVVNGQFSNGVTKAIGKIPVTTFASANNLEAVSGNVFRISPNSGEAIAHVAGTGGAGQVRGSTIEAATVDLASEFTELIVAQRNFSANSKSITTADQLLEELTRLIR